MYSGSTCENCYDRYHLTTLLVYFFAPSCYSYTCLPLTRARTVWACTVYSASTQGLIIVGQWIGVVDNNRQFVSSWATFSACKQRNFLFFFALFQQFIDIYNLQWHLNLEIWQFLWSQTDDRWTKPITIPLAHACRVNNLSKFMFKADHIDTWRYGFCFNYQVTVKSGYQAHFVV